MFRHAPEMGSNRPRSVSRRPALEMRGGALATHCPITPHHREAVMAKKCKGRKGGGKGYGK